MDVYDVYLSHHQELFVSHLWLNHLSTESYNNYDVWQLSEDSVSMSWILISRDDKMGGFPLC